MKNLVDQDAFELAAAREDFGIQQDQPFRNRRRGEMPAQRCAHLNTNRTPAERRQHYLAAVGFGAFAFNCATTSGRRIVGAKRFSSSARYSRRWASLISSTI